MKHAVKRLHLRNLPTRIDGGCKQHKIMIIDNEYQVRGKMDLGQLDDDDDHLFIAAPQ